MKGSRRTIKKLTSFIGSENLLKFDITKNPKHLYAGDILILSSDGLLESLNKKEIMKIIERKLNAQEYSRELIEVALGKNQFNQDNINICVIKVETK